MTATDVGLPDSPVVDGRRHLTSEWLHALGEIEKLNSLKVAYEKIADANVQVIWDALSEAEGAFDAVLARPVPNNIVSTAFPFERAPPVTQGIPHELGTTVYIPMVQQSNIVSTGFWMMPIPSNGFTNMPTKDANIWNLAGSIASSPDQVWFTFAITA